jgi:cytochrome c oxidase cbb3-type subunit 3/ubiquinol-cytochrome c reductase cytochrome c subunit
VLRGAAFYQQMCKVCHGEHGEGERADRAPAIGGADFLAAVSDDFLRRAIGSGRLGTTMSAWSKDVGGPLASSDIDALIAFLRSRSRQPPRRLDDRPLHGDLVRGSVLYARECQHCHGPRGWGGPDVRIGNRQLLVSASDGFLRDVIGRGRSNTRMRGFAATLGAAGVDDVIAYLRHLQDSAPLAAPPVSPPPPLKLGPVPVHPRGPEPIGFRVFPEMTSVDDVHAQLARGARMALLDARVPTDYVGRHIASAVSVPFYDPSPYLGALPRDAWLVCYCACPHAESSELALKLMAAGFVKVTVLQEGLSAWIARGFATHRGERP